MLNANRVVSTERLIDELWGEDPPRGAIATVQVYVSTLRRALQPDRVAGQPSSLLVTRKPGYVLQVSPEDVDLLRFEALVNEGRHARAAGDLEHASARLREALDLWRGPALGDLAGELFADRAAVRLEEERLAALEERIDADLALGRHARLIGELEGLIAEHPLRERPRAQLMLALYRSGRQADALSAYRSARATLVDELGIEPGPELQRMEQAVLAQDPALDLPPSPVPQAQAPQAPPSGPGPEPHTEHQPQHAPEAGLRELRKTLTAVVVEVVPDERDTAPDLERLRRELHALHETARASLERAGGLVERSPEGRLVALFGTGVAREDDAMRAVRAAAEIVAASPTQPESRGPAMAVGVATGEALVELGPGAGPVVTGDVVGGAARLAARASGGEVLLTPSTLRLVADAVHVEPFADGLRLLEIVPGAPWMARRLDAPLVGRRRERAALRQAYEWAVEDRSCHLVTVLGPPGIGKSRLAAELVSDVGEGAIVLCGRCRPSGEGSALGPVVEIVSQAADLAGADTAEAVCSRLTAALAGEGDTEIVVGRLAEVVGCAEPSSSPEELFWAVRRLLEAKAHQRPVVVLVDDIHWAEPSALDLIDHLVDWCRNSPVLIVCGARMELLESRPGWGGGKPNATSVLLEPLGPGDCDRLLDHLVGPDSLSGHVRDRINTAAEGNPLFVEEMLSALIDDGLLVERDECWVPTVDLDQVPVPPTIAALLAARLDRLGPEERSVLERAAVMGRVFWRAAVADLAAPEDRPATDRHLLDLMRRELISPDRSVMAADEAFRFRHALIRDAAYAAVPKAARAGMHERFAAWLVGAAAERPGEHEATVGHHLERACRLRAEIGAATEADLALARRAAEWLVVASQRAYGHDDHRAMASLLARAVALLPPGDAARLPLLPELGFALTQAGELERAEDVLTEAIGEAVAAELPGPLAHATVQRHRLRFLAGRGSVADALTDAERALAFFSRTDDARGMARAWDLVGRARILQGRVGEAGVAALQALHHAQRAGDQRAALRATSNATSALEYGPTPVQEGLRQCEALLSELGMSPTERATVTPTVAHLKAMQGDFVGGRALLREARAVFEEFGMAFEVAFLSTNMGEIELLAGDAVAAEHELRRSQELLAAMGEQSVFATVAALLARALLVQGRVDEALEASDLSRRAAADDDVNAQVQWRGARARALAWNRHREDAVVLAREAVRLAETTDMLNLHGDALLDLTEALVLSGERDEGEAMVAEARELYSKKGNVVAVQHATSFPERLARATLTS